MGLKIFHQKAPCICNCIQTLSSNSGQGRSFVMVHACLLSVQTNLSCICNSLNYRKPCVLSRDCSYSQCVSEDQFGSDSQSKYTTASAGARAKRPQARPAAAAMVEKMVTNIVLKVLAKQQKELDSGLASKEEASPNKLEVIGESNNNVKEEETQNNEDKFPWRKPMEEKEKVKWPRELLAEIESEQLAEKMFLAKEVWRATIISQIKEDAVFKVSVLEPTSKEMERDHSFLRLILSWGQ